MKFTIVVVMLALALGAQASVLPWGLGIGHDLGHVHGIAVDHSLGLGHGLSYTAVSGPAVWDGSAILGHGAAVIEHGGPLLAQGPALGLGLGHGAVVAAAPAAVIAGPIVGHEGQYVAKTRGAVHTAPLAGHINSAASINVQPAPGTI